VKNMETYFIRHINSLDEKTRKRLHKEHRVFIHYPWDKKTRKPGDLIVEALNPKIMWKEAPKQHSVL